MKQTANQDIRDYMADHGVTQMMLAQKMGVKLWKVNAMLRTEMPDKEKEDIIRHIDAIETEVIKETEELPEETEEAEEVEQTNGPKFQIGDRVKIPSKANKIGTVSDIWSSMARAMIMYAVENEGDGYCGMYAEDQLEPAPIPTTYTWEAHIDGNVAVVTMIATQGEKEWVYARGHAHILHDGEVGQAQAIRYAARRMFESLDSKQDNKIYVKGETK